MMENNTCRTLLVCLSTCVCACVGERACVCACRRSYSSWKWQVLAGSVWRNVRTNQEQDDTNAEQSGDKTACFPGLCVRSYFFPVPLSTC